VVDVIRSKTQKIIGPRKTYEFGLEFYRDGVPEVHEFKAYPALDAGSLNYTLSGAHQRERAIEGMVRSIRKMLADDDGTPLGFKAELYTPPQSDVESEFDDHEEHPFGEPEPTTAVEEELSEFDDDTLFIGPDGEPHDGEFIRKALEFEAGSSRRRFAHLMDVDEELTLHVDQLQTTYQRLVGKAADRPTRR
jgi:hypothetical protein